MSEDRPFGSGTETSLIGTIAINCISEDHADCLEQAMAAWEKHKQGLPEQINIGSEIIRPRESIYGFAYWLIRWSGLVKPAKSPKNGIQSSGGFARAAALSPKQRSDIASKAASARWRKKRNQ